MTDDERLARERDRDAGIVEGRVNALELRQGSFEAITLGELKNLREGQAAILERVNRRAGAERLGQWLIGLAMIAIGWFASGFRWR